MEFLQHSDWFMNTMNWSVTGQWALVTAESHYNVDIKVSMVETAPPQPFT